MHDSKILLITFFLRSLDSSFRFVKRSIVNWDAETLLGNIQGQIL
jgi:hypothetical protein